MSNIIETVVAPDIVRRSDRGLCIAGTRITLYFVEDHLRSGWSAHALAETLQLTDQQISNILDYLNAHRAEFDREYDRVVSETADREKYWRGRELKLRNSRKAESKRLSPERAAALKRLDEIKRQETSA